MSFESPMVVLLIAHSQYRSPYLGVAKRLKKNLGAIVHLYTSTRQEQQYYKSKYPGLFETIQVSYALYQSLEGKAYDEKEVVAQAELHERELDIPINTFAVSDRHLGRGYSLGGFRHPRSLISEQTDYIQMLHRFNCDIDYWQREVDGKEPNLILNPGKRLSVIAKNRGIATRTFAGARYENYYYWAANEYLEPPSPVEANAEVSNTKKQLVVDKPYAGYANYRKRFDSKTNFWPTVRESILTIARFIYWKIRRYDKAKGYFLADTVAYLWRIRAATRRMTSQKLKTLDDIRGTKFVFFPLATEPETALQLLSPEYMWQLSAIASVCRDLPAGYKLIVKEHHTAAGRRPRDFYSQIAEFKNVEFLNMSEPGFYVVKEAAAVVTITGTAGFEAALLGIPAIVFGRHNVYRTLNHVLEIDSETDLRPALRAALFDDWSAAEDEGKAFLAAWLQQSFDMGNYTPWERDIIADDEVDRAYDALMNTLRPV